MSGKRRMPKRRRPNAMRPAGPSKRKQLSLLNKIPPVFASQTIIRRQRYDFTGTGGFGNFVPASFFFAYFTGETATTAKNQFVAVRIRRIELWTPPSNNGGIQTASIEFPSPQATNGTPGSRDVESVATTIGAAECGHVVAIPDPRGLAGMWLNSQDSTTVIVVITSPAGSIVDVTYDLVLGWDSTFGSPFTYSGLSAGAVYTATVRQSGGTQVLTPVGSVITD